MEERAFTRACFAGIEDRLLPEKRLRPPLAADKVSERTPSAPGPSTAPAQRESKGKGKGKGRRPPRPPRLPRRSLRTFRGRTHSCPPPPHSNQPWVKVVSRKRKGKKKVAPKPPAAKPAAAVEKRRNSLFLRKVRSRSGHVDPRGSRARETYESVLRRARANVDPAQLGRVGSRAGRTQTGARIFEFSGAQVYDWTAEQRALNRSPALGERENVREEVREAITRHWAEELASAEFGRRTLDAIGPWHDWRFYTPVQKAGLPQAGLERLSGPSGEAPKAGGCTGGPGGEDRFQKEQRTRTTRAKAGYGASSVLYADHSVEEMERMALEDPGGDLGGGIQVLQSERDLSEGPEMPGSELARHRKGVGAAHHLRRNAATAGEGGSPAKRGVGAARARCRAHGPA
ncbi:hypothetical protein HW555_013798 [Spodoptera exigua]|uniref:Uncharacterized protein n=1 Tax=Spodoptera exigua TaxID=7107 RepID=A0A835G2N4_SPOEX|nr:hypothetical protein HW555_013798 [Spodoptera exigua]